jgi:hypothetical protein
LHLAVQNDGGGIRTYQILLSTELQPFPPQITALLDAKQKVHGDAGGAGGARDTVQPGTSLYISPKTRINFDSTEQQQRYGN